MAKSFRRAAALGLLCFAVLTAVPACLLGQEEDEGRLAMAGGNLTEDAARKLESQVASNPGDVNARVQLLGYYFMASHGSAEARAARQQHILWLIRNRPETAILASPFGQLDPVLDGSAYEEGKRAWQEQVERDPKNTAILGRAAMYSLVYDAATAEDLYKRAETAEPQSFEWPRQLGALYALGLSRKTGEARQAAAQAALDAYERAMGLMKDVDREALLSDAAKAALDAGQTEKARAYAEELLKASDQSDWNYGNRIHDGHVILGRIALRGGDLEKAKEHLLAAGQTPGSPQLDSFGPNMTLAKELLEKGEKTAVLEYFKRCASFWRKAELEAWSQEVQAGKIPDFGANLDY